MLDDDKPTNDEKQLARVRWFMNAAVQNTGVILAQGDVSRLAVSFNNAMHFDSCVLMFIPTEEVAK